MLGGRVGGTLRLGPTDVGERDDDHHHHEVLDEKEADDAVLHRGPHVLEAHGRQGPQDTVQEQAEQHLDVEANHEEGTETIVGRGPGLGAQPAGHATRERDEPEGHDEPTQE